MSDTGHDQECMDRPGRGRGGGEGEGERDKERLGGGRVGDASEESRNGMKGQLAKRAKASAST
jgi:hypothetical protein